MEVFSIGYSLLAVQNALLDVVTPELRAVLVDFCKKKQELYIRFYYDGDVSVKLIDLWACAITEASADMGPDCALDDGVERLDYPQKIPLRGRYAYLRREPAQSANQEFPTTVVNVTREIVENKEWAGIFVSPLSGEKLSTNWGIVHHTTEGSQIIPVKPITYKIEIFPIAYALLATQRALLGKVTPALRTVIVDVCKEKNLHYIHFYYDGEPGKKIIDLWEYAITEAHAAMGIDYALDSGIHRLDYPQKPPFRGRYAYLRKE